MDAPTEVFDERSMNWVANDADVNLLFLRTTHRYINDRFRARGYVFLNEVLDTIGLPITPEGQVLGWSFSGQGDGHIDFGIDEREDGCFDLEFNIDGFILDKLPPRKKRTKL